LKRKERPGYAVQCVDDARQFTGTSFCHRRVRNCRYEQLHHKSNLADLATGHPLYFRLWLCKES